MKADDRHLMCSSHRPAPVMARGEGSYLFDEEGRRYLDFVQGWAVNCLGHCPEVVQRALAAQAATLINPSPAYHNRPQLELAEELTSRTRLDRAFFMSTGAEANEGAIKLARKWGQLHRGGAATLVTTGGSFHGRTLATMAASGKAGWEAMFAPMPAGFRKVPFGDAEAVDAAIDEDVVAVMVEPIQGEGGVVVPPPGYLRALRELTRRRGVLLVLDEVQTGVGRTGHFLGAFAEEGVDPDIVTLGKGLGAGLPISALLAREEVSCFAPGEQGGTFCGTPLSTAVARDVVRTVGAPAFLEGVRARGQALRTGLEEIAAGEANAHVRGRGLLLALEMPGRDAPAIARRAFDAGLLLNAPRPHTLRFMPALDVAPEDLDAGLTLLREVLASTPGAAPAAG